MSNLEREGGPIITIEVDCPTFAKDYRNFGLVDGIYDLRIVASLTWKNCRTPRKNHLKSNEADVGFGAVGTSPYIIMCHKKHI